VKRSTLAACLLLALLPAVAGCFSEPAANFGQSELPGGGIRIPHNERLHLSTDHRWIQKEGHLSDLIRLQWTSDRAKPAIAWVDEQGNDKAAIIAHEKANDPSQHEHRHMSIETTMSPDGEYAGQLFTRLEVPYDTDVSEIRTHSSNFNVMNGILRVAGEPGTDREVQFGEAEEGNAVSPRWSIRLSRSPESGDNRGSDLQIVRYGDDGEAVDAPLTIQRSSGFVGLGTAEPETRLDVNGDRMRIREPFTPASSGDPCGTGQIAWDENYLYVCVKPNEWKRAALFSW